MPNASGGEKWGGKEGNFFKDAFWGLCLLSGRRRKLSR